MLSLLKSLQNIKANQGSHITFLNFNFGLKLIREKLVYFILNKMIQRKAKSKQKCLWLKKNQLLWLLWASYSHIGCPYCNYQYHKYRLLSHPHFQFQHISSYKQFHTFQCENILVLKSMLATLRILEYSFTSRKIITSIQVF